MHQLTSVTSTRTVNTLPSTASILSNKVTSLPSSITTKNYTASLTNSCCQNATSPENSRSPSMVTNLSSTATTQSNRATIVQ